MDKKCAKVLVLDDLISSSASSDQKTLEEIFFYYTHHYNFITFLLTQNLFHNNRVFRGISLNTHYFILFPNKRDKLQCRVLFRQVEPKNHSFLEEVYHTLSDESCYNYLFLDLHPKSDPLLKVRSDILNPLGATVWLQKAPPASASLPVTSSDLKKEVVVNSPHFSIMSDTEQQSAQLSPKEDQQTVVVVADHHIKPLSQDRTVQSASVPSVDNTQEYQQPQLVDNSSVVEFSPHEVEEGEAGEERDKEEEEERIFYTMLHSGDRERLNTSELTPEYVSFTLAILKKILYMINTESKKRLQEYFLKQASLETIIAICECFLNISKKFVPLSKRELAVLTGNRRVIRKLAPVEPVRFTKSRVEEIRKTISKNTHILKYIIRPVLSYLEIDFQRQPEVVS